MTPNESQASFHTIYFIIALVPILVLFLSGGIAWGVTTATIRGMKSALEQVYKEHAATKDDFNTWKQERRHTVVTVPMCDAVRAKCSGATEDKIGRLTEKFDEYVGKADARWSNLAVQLGVLTGVREEEGRRGGVRATTADNER